MKGAETIDIVCSEERKLCIIAGPGTGKTFTLKRKVLKLLEERNDPSRMLVVTFSRTAASDIKKELAELGFEGTDKITARTLHSFCFSVLNREGVFDSVGRETRILMDYEKRFMLEDLRNLGLGTITELEKKLKAFEAAWARLQTEEPGWPNNEDDKLFQKKLLDWLKFHDAMILEEIVPETYKYLRDNPSAPENEMFDYIFVDEYQDLNKAEQRLLELLSENASVMVIGDEDQTIYENFRYAHPEGIVEYAKNHTNGHKPLNTCRRCPQNVIDLATELISNNDIRYFEKNLVSAPENGEGDITIVQWRSLNDEIEGIVDYISKKITDQSVEAGRILVLTPSRHFGYKIRDKINETENLTAHSFFTEQELGKKGTPKNVDECQHKVAFTLLTLLAHPDDKVALRCWLGFGSQNLKARSYQKLHNYCLQANENPFNVLDKVISGELAIRGINYLIKDYIGLKEAIEELKSLKGYELLDKLFPEGESWSKQFRSILYDMNEDSTALEIYNELKSNITQPEMPMDVDFIRVMSLHKSKGLTADLVVICGAIEGLIPFRPRGLVGESLERHLEEQRRLFYVGITRTTGTLVVSTFLELPAALAHVTIPNLTLRRRAGNVRTITSRFISELGSGAPRVISGERWNY